LQVEGNNLTLRRLYNLHHHPPPAPLIVYLPPFSSSSEFPSPPLPRFLQRYAVAVIQYRWAGSSPLRKKEDFSTPLHWPTPIHDTLFGYSWLVENLSPTKNGRRDVYVYGSYLGATLATSLALTESYSHHRMAIRGLAAFNGIYNWTMFLPDHRINMPTTTRSGKFKPAPQPPEGSTLSLLRQQLPVLFSSPANLFDPFVSPCLFFQTPGLLVPKSSSVIDLLSSVTSEAGSPTASPFTQPRRSSLVFPPRRSSLKIPESLFLFDTFPEPVPPGTERKPTADSLGRTRRRTGPKGNSFGLQANEIASLMRRSIDKVELKERRKWDEDFWDWETEAQRRVQVADVGFGNGTIELTQYGANMLQQWLQDQIHV
jgi:hypothetical protein